MLAFTELQFDEMHIGNYNSTRNASVGRQLKLLLPQVTADGLWTGRRTRLGLGMRAERGSLNLISYDVSYCTCQQFENVRSVAQRGMESN